MAAIISGQTTLEQNSYNRRHRRLDRRDVPGDSSHICRSTTRHFATGAQRSREDWSGTAQPRKATDCSWQVDSWQRLLVLCKLNRGALRISRLNAARLSEFWMCGLRSVGHSSAGRIEAAGMFGAGRQGLTSCGKRLVSIPDLPKSCSAGAEARGSFCCVSGGCPPGSRRKDMRRRKILDFCGEGADVDVRGTAGLETGATLHRRRSALPRSWKPALRRRKTAGRADAQSGLVAPEGYAA
jgi:hypothetical protein